MNLKAIAENAVDVAYGIAGKPAAGGALETVTLHLGKAQTYNFDTDKMVESGGSEVEADGVFYSEIQKGGGPTTSDAVFTVRGKDAPAGIFEADTLTRDGKVWQIDEVKPIPTKALYLVYLRK